MPGEGVRRRHVRIDVEVPEHGVHLTPEDAPPLFVLFLRREELVHGLGQPIDLLMEVVDAAADGPGASRDAVEQRAGHGSARC